MVELLTVVLFVFANCLPMWLIIAMHKHVQVDLASKRDAPLRFRPFQCSDYADWTYLRALFTHSLFIPRYLISWACNALGALSVMITLIGAGPVEEISAFRYELVTKAAAFWIRLITFFTGFIWFS